MKAPAESRIPCLDGLRAVSISLVIFMHQFHGAIRKVGDLGNMGVRMFFVISGFLITTLLIAEMDRTGAVSLRQFYLRRTFRIFPAFYVYIAAIALAGALGWISLHPHDLLAAVTYTMNYHPDRAWDLGHLWSLAVEEQFYLLWPAAFATLGKRRALRLAAAAVVLVPVIRVVTYLYFPSQRPSIGESFHTIADSLATGCVLALVRDRVSDFPRIDRILRHGATPVLFVAIAVITNYFRWYISYGYSVGQTLTNVALAIVVESCVRNPETLTGRALELRPLAYVGTLSYSIYLWQQPFMATHRGSIVTQLPLNLLVIAACALSSYYGVEKPMLEVRKRFSRRPDKGRPAPA